MELQELTKAYGDLAEAWAEFKDEADKGRKADETKLRRLNDAMDETQKRISLLEVALKRPGIRSGIEGADAWKHEEGGKAFCTYLRKGDRVLEPEETKALVVADDAAAGYYAPAEFSNEITKAVVEMSPFRTVARVTTIGAKSLLLPKRTGTFAARRVAEIGTRSETTGYTTGQNEIVAPEMYAEVHVSQQLLEDNAVNLESELQLEFAEQFAVKEGAEFINGNGAEEAEGILSNSEVASTNSGSASAISDANGQVDGLVDLMFDLKTSYRQNGTFLANRLTIGALRKLKDDNRQYIWQPSLQQGQPDRLLGAPMLEMPDMPDVASGAFPLAFGDFRRAYRIVDRIQMSILSDPYTLANVGQRKFLARKRVGGALVLPEACRKLRIAA